MKLRDTGRKGTRTGGSGASEPVRDAREGGEENGIGKVFKLGKVPRQDPFSQESS